MVIYFRVEAGGVQVLRVHVCVCLHTFVLFVLIMTEKTLIRKKKAAI